MIVTLFFIAGALPRSAFSWIAGNENQTNTLGFDHIALLLLRQIGTNSKGQWAGSARHQTHQANLPHGGD